MLNKSVFVLVFIVITMGCIEDKSLLPGEVEGYKPQYATDTDNSIKFLTPQKMSEAGKIYVYEDFLLVNDRYKGVHVVNNSNPESPTEIMFIQIPGNVDIAVRDYVLYADNYSDLVAIDISDVNTPKVCDRQANVFAQVQEYPNVFGVYFECVDKSKGNVIGWELTTLTDPKCYR